MVILAMSDGGIVSIDQDKTYFAGCQTCDYGSNYINNIRITTIKYILSISVEKMYEHALSEGDMMKILLPNCESIQAMQELDFLQWLVKEVKTIVLKNDASLTFDIVKR